MWARRAQAGRVQAEQGLRCLAGAAARLAPAEAAGAEGAHLGVGGGLAPADVLAPRLPGPLETAGASPSCDILAASAVSFRLTRKIKLR